MNRLSNAIAILLLTATTAHADTIPNTCEFIPESPDSCVRFVGCINSDGAYFYGTSAGWGKGSVYGKTSEGETCHGNWENDSDGQKGAGNLDCGPVEKAEFKYFRRGEDFIILSGVAISSTGRRMITWAGDDLEGYLKVKFPDGKAPGFQCGKTWVPLPTEFPMSPY